MTSDSNQLRALALATLLSGLAISSPAQAFFGEIFESAKRAVTGEEEVSTRTTKPEVVGSTEPLKANKQYMPIRSSKELEDIFIKRKRISGQEAFKELEAMRKAVHGKDIQTAMSQLYGYESRDLLQQGQSQDLLSRLSLGSLSRSLADQMVTDVSLVALEQFFVVLTENKSFFKDIYVDLPADTTQLTPMQRQRVLILAASLIAVKGSNQIVEAAKQDFERAMKGYEQLVDKREKAAEVLFTAMDAWRQASAANRIQEAQGLDGLLTQDDLAFLDRFPKDIRMDRFVEDFTAQNIALEYLRKKGEKRFDDYQAAAGEYVNTINEHLRRTVGLGAMAGFSSLFLREGERAFQQEGVQSIRVVLPFLDQYLTELGTALTAGAPSMVGGWFDGLFGRGDGFRIEKLDGVVVDKKANFEDVLSFMKDKGVYPEFAGNLYRTDNRGYLFRVNLCGNAAGPMLDKAVSKDVNGEFVQGFYKLEDPAGFSFSNAFDGSYQTKRRSEVVAALLATDYRSQHENPTEKAIGAVQKATEKGMKEWDERDLARIIFASSLEGAHSLSRLQLGDYVVRVLPSQWMVYEYENYQQNCLNVARERIKKDELRQAGKHKGASKKAVAVTKGKKSKPN